MYGYRLCFIVPCLYMHGNEAICTASNKAEVRKTRWYNVDIYSKFDPPIHLLNE